jgi:di/tricarboxylate transporter
MSDAAPPDVAGEPEASSPLDAELSRSASVPSWRREKSGAGGSATVGALVAFVVSAIPVSFLLDADNPNRVAANLAGGILLVIALGLALPRATRRTGLGALGGELLAAAAGLILMAAGQIVDFSGFVF